MGKKILLISYRLGYDSLLYWDKILSYIKAKHIDFTVYTAWKPCETKDRTVTTENRINGVKLYVSKNKLNQKLIFLPLPGFLISVRKLTPDIIILNEFNLASFYIVLYKRFIYRRARILLLVESAPNFKEVNDPSRTPLRTFYRQFIARSANIVLTNNQIGYQYINKGLKVQDNRIKIRPYLTSNPPIGEKSITRDTSRIHLITVGRLIERKGHKYLIEAISNLPAEVQDKILLRIIGEGPLRQSLFELCERRSVKCVNIIGAVDYGEMYLYYHDSDCLILPTLQDYRSLVGFEALSFGLAIITSKFDGSRFEVIKEGENGFIVDPFNTIDFSEKLQLLISNKTLLEKFKQQSSAMAAEYSERVCIENLLSTIDEL